MPVAKDMKNLDEHLRRFIEAFDGSISELSTSDQDRNLSKSNQPIDKMKKNTDDLITESDSILQCAHDSLSN